MTLFCSDRGYYPHFVDIIRILWIFMFCGYYPHFMDIIRILWISWIYLNFVDIICIGHIKIYLDNNYHPILRIYSSSVSDWCRRRHGQVQQQRSRHMAVHWRQCRHSNTWGASSQ